MIGDRKVSDNVRYACIGAVGRWHYTDIIPELQKLLQKIDSWPLRSRLMIVLNTLGDETIQLDIPSDENATNDARNSLIQFLIDQNACSLAPS